jgi:hypothetical protein
MNFMTTIIEELIYQLNHTRVQLNEINEDHRARTMIMEVLLRLV